jgi:glycosyltransferase involved in cell wall biosynthesis
MDQKKKTKVLIFSLTYFPFVGGAEVALYEITKRIPSIEFDLITAKISQNLPDSETIGNLHIFRVGKGNKSDKYLYPLRAFLFSRKLCKKNQYNLIWAMLASWAGMAALLFKLFNSQVKYLLTLQSGDSNWFIWLRSWFWYPVYKMIYTKADHIQVISNWLKRRARRYGYKNEISLVPNGVDLKKFQISNFKFQIDELKKELNIPTKNKIVFTSSRLVKKNDIATLIKSIHLLITRYSLRITLLIAGTGKLEQKLRDLTRDLKLAKNVIFLGHVQHSQISKYYQLADVFARPSLSEGQGISFIEAMAVGVPVVATPVGGIPDFLLDKKTGLFCKTKNPRDLAEKIKLLFEDKKLYQEIQTNGLELVKQKYDWDLIARRMKKIFNSLIVSP